MSFKVYALENCPYSMNAVRLLQDNNVPTQVKWITRDEKDRVKAKHGWETFPQVYWGAHKVGGFEQLDKLIRVAKACRDFTPGTMDALCSVVERGKLSNGK